MLLLRSIPVPEVAIPTSDTGASSADPISAKDPGYHTAWLMPDVKSPPGYVEYVIQDLAALQATAKTPSKIERKTYEAT